MSRALWSLASLAGFVLALALVPSVSATSLWNDVTESSISPTGTRWIAPLTYRTLYLDMSELRRELERAPNISDRARAEAPILELRLPLPDGRDARFDIVGSPIMAPSLAARFPEIQTFAGQGIDDRAASVRFDVTPSGFHAIIISPAGTVYIDPYQAGDMVHYTSYDARDYVAIPGSAEFGCAVDAMPDAVEFIRNAARSGVPLGTGDQLRTYRTAVAATGEYTDFHGGTILDGQAAIVTAINRITGITELEIAVRLELVANNDQLVYTDGATDPYTNGDPVAMLNENQMNVDAEIGEASYDLGHVFGTIAFGGSGVAQTPGVCWPSVVDGSQGKARGVTTRSDPIGDPFYVQLLAHEFGHQFGATHSMNGTANSCAPPFGRSDGNAWEPGSGSTIMSYAGICGTHNIATDKDDYYHTGSYDQMVAWTQAGFFTCGTVTTTGNTPPTAVAGAGGFSIPIGTPFTLTGSGSDADGGDVLSYCWEEFDQGLGGDPQAPVGDAPIFRSFPAVMTPPRTFPQISDILDDTQTIGELLPTYSRNLTFRLTVRDNRSGGGGVVNSQIAFLVTDTAGPFLVTAPNTAVVWTGGTTETVTWDVANTDIIPVSSALVDILLSTDGGLTFPTTLVAGTANDGSESVTVPATATTSARIKVAAADNVFFDLSDVVFEIQDGKIAVDDVRVPRTLTHVLLDNVPNPFNPATTIEFELARDTIVSLAIFDATGHRVRLLADAVRRTAGSHTARWDGTNEAGKSMSTGLYFARLETSDGYAATRSMVLLK